MLGGILPILIVTVYAVMVALSLIVLWRLVILLPIMTRLATAAHGYMRSLHSDDRPPERRLFDLEDLLRLNAITPEEYEAKRKDILHDL